MMPSPEGGESPALRFYKAALAYFLATLLLGVLMITGRGYALFGPLGAKPAHVHAGVLGFITLIIMGSMYQIVPTLTGARLYGGDLEKRQFWLMNAGVLGLFLTLLFADTGPRKSLTLVFGTAILIASLLFAYIIFRTMTLSRSKIKPVTIPFFKAAIIYYLAGIAMGLAMTLYPKFFSQFLLAKTAHAHLGTLGFITMTIFGAEYQMFPMLSLQKLWSEKLAKINLWTFTIGVAGYFAGLMALNALVLTFFVALLLLSTYIFLANMLLTLKGARWKGLDISVKYLVAGHFFLFITTAIGSAMAVFYHLGLLDWMKASGLASQGLSIYGLIWTHAHLALIGFVTLTIIGAMYHLAPMLVWMKRYGPKMGREPVPRIQELFSQRLASLILWAMIAGLIGLLTGSLYGISTLLRSSGLVLAGAGALFAYAMYRLMF